MFTFSTTSRHSGKIVSRRQKIYHRRYLKIVVEIKHKNIFASGTPGDTYIKKQYALRKLSTTYHLLAPIIPRYAAHKGYYHSSFPST